MYKRIYTMCCDCEFWDKSDDHGKCIKDNPKPFENILGDYIGVWPTTRETDGCYSGQEKWNDANQSQTNRTNDTDSI